MKEFMFASGDYDKPTAISRGASLLITQLVSIMAHYLRAC
jgi:hypothetical protein